MIEQRDIVALSAVRTPMGKFGGTLRDVPVHDLGEHVIRHSIDRAGITPDSVDRIIFGQCRQAGNGPNPARTAAVRAGVPESAYAETINAACASGMRAVQIAAQSIRTGESEIVVAGGMDSMSTIPFLVKGVRWDGLRLGDGRMIDGWSDSFDPLVGKSMGALTEDIVRKYGISRSEMDEYALASHRRAAAAWDGGLFDGETAPYTIAAAGRSPEVRLERDEAVRKDTTLEKLARLSPVFEEGGKVTAGNACPMSDGAAAIVLTTRDRARALGLRPLFSIPSYSALAVDPRLMLEGPAKAIPAALSKAALTLSDMDIIEINEAFAAKIIVSGRLLNLDYDRLNVRGGAIALGHPVGASGARILVTLYHALAARGGEFGAAAIGGAGGVTTATVIRRAG